MKKNMFKKIGILSISAVFALGAKNVAAMEPEKSVKSAEAENVTVIELEKSHQAMFGFSFDKAHRPMAIDNLKISENLQRFMSKTNAQKRIDSQVRLQEAQAQEAQAQEAQAQEAQAQEAQAQEAQAPNVPDTVVSDNLCGLQILHDTEQESMSQESEDEKRIAEARYALNEIKQIAIALRVNEVGPEYTEVAVQTDMLNIAELQNVQQMYEANQKLNEELDEAKRQIDAERKKAQQCEDENLILAAELDEAKQRFGAELKKSKRKFDDELYELKQRLSKDLKKEQQKFSAELKKRKQIEAENQKLFEELKEGQELLLIGVEKAQQSGNNNRILTAELNESKQENEALKEQIKSLKKRDDQELKLQNDFQPTMRNFAAPVVLAAAPYERIVFQEDDQQNSVLHEIEIQDGPVDQMNNFSATNTMSYANFEKAGNGTVPNFDTGNKLLESQNDVQDKLVAITVPVAHRQVTANDRGVDKKTSNLVKSIFGLLSMGK